MATPIPTTKAFLAWKKKEEQNRREGKPIGYYKDPDTGVTWYLDRKNEAGKPTRFSPKSTAAKAKENGVNGKHRRATTKGKEISLQEYIDWAKRNLYIDPIRYATEIFNGSQEKLNNVRNDKTPGTVYGHVSPISSPMKGGLEHHRTVARQDPKSNGRHLDRVPSTEAHQRAGIPLTRSGAIRADMRQMPVLPARTRLAIIQKDLDNNARPTARQLRKRLQRLGPEIAQLSIGNAAGIRLAD